MHTVASSSCPPADLLSHVCSGRMAIHHAVENGHGPAEGLLLRAASQAGYTRMEEAELRDGRTMAFLHFQSICRQHAGCEPEQKRALSSADVVWKTGASARTFSHCDKQGASPLSIAVKVSCRPDSADIGSHAWHSSTSCAMESL